MLIKDYKKWYSEHFFEMNGNGLWFRGDELNTLPASEFLNRTYRILITRLSTYWDTADSFTHKLLYQFAVNQREIYADMAFLPPASDAELFEKYSIPWLTGCTSKVGAEDFDMIAISNSIIEEVISIPVMLEKSRIPLKKLDRLENNKIPLVILGGANALYTSALYTRNPLVDGIFVGEDVSLVKQIFRIASDGKRNGLNKKEILSQLESVAGFFQPEKEYSTRKFTSMSISEEQLLNNAPVMYTDGQLGTGNLQISEGCPSFCSFCAESWGRKPYRELSFDTVKKAAFAMKCSMGLETIELFSFNFNMHRNFYDILKSMSELFSGVGLKSQRFDTIADEPELLKILHAVGKTSITCGLEGISQRLRKYLHKSLDEKTLHNSLSLLIRAPIRELKIFLIATGKETADDFSEFCTLLQFLNDTICMAGRRPRIIFSMTPLVRFPYTPLECEDAPEPEVCKEIVLQTERFVRSRGFEFRSSADTNDYYLSQIMVRMYDPNASEALFSVALQKQFVYYKEIPSSIVASIKEEMEKCGIENDSLLKGISEANKISRPVTINVSGSFFDAQSKAAIEYKDNGYCLGTRNSDGICHACGACDTNDSINSITTRHDKKSYPPDILRKIFKERQDAISLNFRVLIPTERCGIPRKNIAISLARAIMLCDSRFAYHFLSYKESYVETRFDSPWIIGDDIITLSFHKKVQTIIDCLLKEDMIEKINSNFNSWGTLINIEESKSEIQSEFTIESSLPFNATNYFKMQSIKYISKKIAENTYSCDFTKDSIKKKIIKKCVSERKDETSIVKITPLEKFKFNEFIDTVFVMPTPQHRYTIKTTHTIL